MKYAELPDGKILKFPDTVSDKEMQRVVQRELGISTADTSESLLKVVDKLDTLVNSRVKDFGDAASQSLAGVTVELTKSVQMIAKVQEKHAVDVLRAMQSQTALISKLQASIDALNKTMDVALGQSLETMDKSMGMAGGTAARMEQAIKEISVSEQRLGKLFETMLMNQSATKRAYRNRDGSWTMEVIRPRRN